MTSAQRRRSELDPLLTVEVVCVSLSMVILRLPIIVPSKYAAIAKYGALLPFIALAGIACVRFLARPRIASRWPGSRVLLAAYVALILLSLLIAAGDKRSLRTAVGKDAFVQWTVVWLGLSMTFLPQRHPASSRRLALAACAAPIIYLLANLGLWLVGVVGVGSGDPGSATILGALGISAARVRFALAGGVNVFGALAAAVAAGAAAGAARKKDIRVRALWVIVAAAAFVACVLVDARAALVVGLFVAALPFISNSNFKRWGWVSVLILITATVALVQIPAKTLSHDSLSSPLQREGEDTTFNGRTLIWHAALVPYRQFDFQQLFGYGFLGQVSTGVASANLDLEPTTAEIPELAWHPHSGVLQTLLDSGYVGIIVLSLCLIVALQRLGKSADTASLFFLGFLVTIILNAATETLLVPYAPETYAGVVLALSVAFGRTCASDAAQGPRARTLKTTPVGATE